MIYAPENSHHHRRLRSWHVGKGITAISSHCVWAVESPVDANIHTVTCAVWFAGAWRASPIYSSHCVQFRMRSSNTHSAIKRAKANFVVLIRRLVRPLNAPNLFQMENNGEIFESLLITSTGCESQHSFSFASINSKENVDFSKQTFIMNAILMNETKRFLSKRQHSKGWKTHETVSNSVELPSNSQVMCIVSIRQSGECRTFQIVHTAVRASRWTIRIALQNVSILSNLLEKNSFHPNFPQHNSFHPNSLQKNHFDQ